MDSVVVMVVRVELLFEVVVVEWMVEYDWQVVVVEMEVIVQYLHLCMREGGEEMEQVLMEVVQVLVSAKHQQGRQLVPNQPPFQQKQQKQV